MFGRSVSTAESDFYGTVLSQGQRDVKVNQTDISVRLQHDICGLDVTVQDAVRRPPVQIFQRLQQLAGPSHYLRLGKPAFPLQQPVHALALNIVHDGIDNPVLLYKVIHLRNISLAQPLQHVHFPAQRFLPRRQAPLVRFQDDILIQADMPSQIDHTAASRAYLCLQLI